MASIGVIWLISSSFNSFNTYGIKQRKLCQIHLIQLLLRFFLRLTSLYRNILYFSGNIRCHQLFYDLFGAVNDRIRHSCKLCDLDTITLVRSTLYDIITFFLDRNTIVIDIANLAFQLGKLMIVGCK